MRIKFWSRTITFRICGTFDNISFSIILGQQHPVDSNNALNIHQAVDNVRNTQLSFK